MVVYPRRARNHGFAVRPLPIAVNEFEIGWRKRHANLPSALLPWIASFFAFVLHGLGRPPLSGPAVLSTRSSVFTDER